MLLFIAFINDREAFATLRRSDNVKECHPFALISAQINWVGVCVGVHLFVRHGVQARAACGQSWTSEWLVILKV